MNYLQRLPVECFPKFTANKINKPRISWRNKRGLEGLSIDEHSYCIPLQNDPPSAYRKETKEFSAERYGGDGLAGNSGGVRCGLDGTIQIKGIGRNLLAGRSTDFFHSYGGASLNEGIVEAIWGEILDTTLPHGAIRCHGLIETGTRVPLLSPKPNSDSTTARALIVREAALRPAHFMRSIYCEPMGEMLLAANDVVRTKAAINSLGGILRSIYCINDSELGENLNWCIEAMFKRFAEQIACARAKRFMHGSLIASNLAVDGRWLDFGTTSAMPDYGRIVISPGTPDFVNEENTLRTLMSDFLFYLRKYLPKDEAKYLASFSEMWSRFNSQVKNSLKHEFLKLTGLTGDAISAINVSICDNFFNSMNAIKNAGNQAIFSILSGAAMPAISGHFHLNTILTQAALSNSPESLDIELEKLLPNRGFRTEFVSNYWAFRRAHFANLDEKRHEFARVFMLINALRLNETMFSFFRGNLYQQIEKLIIKRGNVSQFINNKIDCGLAYRAEPIAGKINLTYWCNKETKISADEGILYDGNRISVENFLPLVSKKFIGIDKSKLRSVNEN